MLHAFKRQYSLSFVKYGCSILNLNHASLTWLHFAKLRSPELYCFVQNKAHCVNKKRNLQFNCVIMHLVYSKKIYMPQIMLQVSIDLKQYLYKGIKEVKKIFRCIKN